MADVSALIKELEDACQRTLFDGISSVPINSDPSTETEVRRSSLGSDDMGSRKRPRDEGQQQQSYSKNWTQLLAEASMCVSDMSDHEHAHVLHLSSIMLLGFLLPYSTGNNYQMLQNISSAGGRQLKDGPKPVRDSAKYVLSMPLLERLECACRTFDVTEVNEAEVFGDDDLDLSFYNFLHHGLAPLFDGRPMNTHSADILHIIAMAIHPQPSEKYVKKTMKAIERADDTPEAWNTSKALWENQVPFYFHVKYGQRVQFVKLIAEHLMLPESHSEPSVVVETKLDAALVHLRAALHSFYHCAMDPYDAHWAQCGSVSCAIQTSKDVIVREEWDVLLKRTMDDRTDSPRCNKYPCLCTVKYDHSASSMTQSSDHFCPHAGRGHLLARFLSKYNEARHYAPIDFLQRCLESLTELVEWQVYCWTNQSGPKADDDGDAEGPVTPDDTEMTSKDSRSKCMLASLLFAAKKLFFYLLPTKSATDGTEESNGDHQNKMLISCAIQLVHHPDPTIVREASDLLSIAFSYGPPETIAHNVPAVFASVKFFLKDFIAREQSTDVSLISLRTLCSLLAQKSPQFADHVIQLLLSYVSDDMVAKNSIIKRTQLLSMLANISRACPTSMKKHTTKLLDIMETDIADTPGAKSHIAAAMLATRMATFFTLDDEKRTSLLSTITDPWHMYQLARHALVTGNFADSSLLYGRLVELASSETAYLWLSALKSIADAELSLTASGFMGIPTAIRQLYSAISLLKGASSLVNEKLTTYHFQELLLQYRIDFLQLVMGLRQLVANVRLTGSFPQKYTRSRLHLKNTLRCFHILARRYSDLYNEKGLFISQQARSSIRTIYSVCHFLACAIEIAFVDALDDPVKHDSARLSKILNTKPLADVSHPITHLMLRLKKMVFDDMDVAVDLMIRAAAMLEVLNCVVKSPIPYPRDITATTPIPAVSLHLTGDVDSAVLLEHSDDGDSRCTVEVAVGSPFRIFVSGKIGADVFKRTKIEFTTVLIRHTMFLISMSDDEVLVDEEKASSAGFSDAMDAPEMSPGAGTSTAQGGLISPNGNFLVPVACDPLSEEGTYIFKARLGCRDIRGGEWSFPLCAQNHSINIQVTSGRQ